METYPIFLVVDDFGVEYVGKQHADHLSMILKKYHNIAEDWEGKKYAGIDLKWDYEKSTCRATMYGYILDLRNKYQHMNPKKHNIHHTNTALLITEIHNN